MGVTPLTARASGAWLAAIGLIGVMIGREGCWARVEWSLAGIAAARCSSSARSPATPAPTSPRAPGVVFLVVLGALAAGPATGSSWSACSRFRQENGRVSLQSSARSISLALAVSAAGPALLAIGYAAQADWATGTWPFETGRLSNLFLASILVAIAVPTLWVSATWIGRARGSAPLPS